MDNIRLVRDYMRKKDLSFDVRDDVADIAATLVEHELTGAPVIGADGVVLGFVSEQDCIKEMLNTAFHCELTATAADIMRSDVLTVDGGMEISVLAEQMCGNKPKMYPVTENGTCVGLITRPDVLRALVDSTAECHQPSR
ncbi:hypothetical protein A9Q99_09350 [Gammaproteobacteria bacterium 45_16_T64]|nr:hypothetical protein A9Q99_09350 [Gammaproteobacteria bacterium 45_16_T64]